MSNFLRVESKLFICQTLGYLPYTWLFAKQTGVIMTQREVDVQGFSKLKSFRKMCAFSLAGALVVSAMGVTPAYAEKSIFDIFKPAEKIEAEQSEIMYPQEIKRDVEELLKVKIKAYAVEVDGKVLAAFSSSREADALLEALKAPYMEQEEGTEILEIYFKEKVEILEEAVSQEFLVDFDETLDYIRRGTKEKRVHVIEAGDYYGKIAEEYGIRVADLEAANPGVSPRKLQIGQKIDLIVPKPFITVMTTENRTYDEAIDYETVYEDNAGIYKGEYGIKIRGQKGVRTVEAKIIRANGLESERVVLREEIVKEPVTQVTYKGTKALPPKIGTGTFQKPARGSVTSEFGWRWGRRHEGIDIGMPTGTSVRASDGGVVTFTGYRSGYGYLVIIDHGANMETRYAHLSKILVSKGTRVYKDQQIALSGNTGTSTGPHLHFEVRKSGVPQNPRNYVNF